jgi:hypothetical protein
MHSPIIPQEAKQGRSAFLSLWLPLILLQLTFAILFWRSIHINNAHLVYALDDTYIHMAIAKNVAQHHVWGVTPFEFTSTSSSPLWTALLSAIYLCFGVNVCAPLVLNLLFASLVLLASWRFLRSQGMQDQWILIVQVLVIYLTPLPFLIFDGMEHSLHALVTILAVFSAACFLERPTGSGHSRRRLTLLAFVLLLSAIRYEGLFFALAVGLLLLLRKRAVDALIVGAAAAAPVLLVGIWAIRHGWPLLPTTIILKSSLSSAATFRGWFRHFIITFRANTESGQHLLALILLSLFFYVARLYKDRGPWDRLNAASAVFVLTAIGHLTCAGVGRFSRYEAYLVAAGIVVIAAQLKGSVPDLFAVPLGRQATLARIVFLVLLGGLLLLPVASRGASALYYLTHATHDIYEQQVQMARFIEKYYEGSSVALNDIGAVNYYAEIHCLDLAGLGSLSVFKAQLASTLNSTTINQLAREANPRIAIVYENWFYDQDAHMSQLPPQWVPVGTWTFPHCIMCGSETVTFFAADPTEGPRLVECLKEFSSQLPADVVQAGLYTQMLPARRG